MHKELFPSIEKVVQRADSIFVQDGASCHQPHLVQTFLKTKWKRRFIHVKKWSLPSPDVNPLNSFCWELRKTKVVEGKIKEKNKICFEYLCKQPSTDKECNQTICSKNKSYRIKKEGLSKCCLVNAFTLKQRCTCGYQSL